jgi:hypothetical protein
MRYDFLLDTPGFSLLDIFPHPRIPANTRQIVKAKGDKAGTGDGEKAGISAR